MCFLSFEQSIAKKCGSVHVTIATLIGYMLIAAVLTKQKGGGVWGIIGNGTVLINFSH